MFKMKNFTKENMEKNKYFKRMGGNQAWYYRFSVCKHLGKETVYAIITVNKYGTAAIDVYNTHNDTFYTPYYDNFKTKEVEKIIKKVNKKARQAGVLL